MKKCLACALIAALLCLPALAAGGYADVPENAWYLPHLTALSDSGVLQGRGDGRFAPEEPVTRAELVEMLARVSGADLAGRSGGFADAPADAWYLPSALWALEQGLVQPDPFSNYYPDLPQGRAQVAEMIWRFLQAQEGCTIPNSYPAPTFADAGDIPASAAESVYFLQKAGVLHGDEQGCFRPYDTLSRAEMCKILAVLLTFMER